MTFQLYAAPMQGHTDSPYRHYHAKIYGEADAYFTPFLRVERGVVRPRDLKSLASGLNENHHLIPQIIFNGEKEFELLVDEISRLGYREIDLNFGCPYPMQTNHGRGAAILQNPELIKWISSRINSIPDISFSVKMRSGLSNGDEWRQVLPVLNDTRLAHITFHPRVAKQKYSGELDMASLDDFISLSRHPVIYNGDLLSPSQIRALAQRFPGLKGVMSGRGLIGRPSLFAEFNDNNEWQKDKRLDMMLKFHDSLREYYTDKLCGEAQVLAKLQSFWEYASEEIGKKAWKGIKKATNLYKYDAAVKTI